VRFWISVCRLVGSQSSRCYSQRTFLAKLFERVWRARDASIFADRIERCTEGIKTFPNCVVLDYL
jgi:hypothetical protein